MLDAAPSSVNLGPKYSFQDENFSARGRAGGAAPPSVNLGAPSYLGNYLCRYVSAAYDKFTISVSRAAR